MDLNPSRSKKNPLIRNMKISKYLVRSKYLGPEEFRSGKLIHLIQNPIWLSKLIYLIKYSFDVNQYKFSEIV